VKKTAEPVRNVPSAVAKSRDCIAKRRDNGVGGISRRREAPRRDTRTSDQEPPLAFT
jgi:hypothetical protein